MEGVQWYADTEGEVPSICAQFDGRTRRIRLFGYGLRGAEQQSALAAHIVAQLTISIKEAREAAAQRVAYAELH